MGDGEEVTRVFDDLSVVVAYLVLIGSSVIHAMALLPNYGLQPLHRNLVLVVTVLIVLYSLWGIWQRVDWATSWG